MVVGNGLVAKIFGPYNNNDKFLIFASGVSDSKSTVQADYDRELNLLKEVTAANKEKTLIYFSTCSLYDPVESQSDYAKHKIKTEQYIQQHVLHYQIIRASNLVGKSENPNTILNFITHNVANDIHFNVWVNATRNIIGIDDFFAIADYLLKNGLHSNSVINIANPENYFVTRIVAEVEEHYNKKGSYSSIEKGANFNIDVSAIQPVIAQLGIGFGSGYLKQMLIKYY